MWFVSGQPVTHTTGLSGKSPADFPRPQLATCPMGLHVQADDEFHKSCLFVWFRETWCLEIAPSTVLVSKQIHVA